MVPIIGSCLIAAVCFSAILFLPNKNNKNLLKVKMCFSNCDYEISLQYDHHSIATFDQYLREMLTCKVRTWHIIIYDQLRNTQSLRFCNGQQITKYITFCSSREFKPISTWSTLCAISKPYYLISHNTMHCCRVARVVAPG